MDGKQLERQFDQFSIAHEFGLYLFRHMLEYHKMKKKNSMVLSIQMAIHEMVHFFVSSPNTEPTDVVFNI